MEDLKLKNKIDAYIDAHQAGRIGVKGNSTHGLADFCIIDNIRQGQHEDNGTAKDDDLLAIDHKPPDIVHRRGKIRRKRTRLR